MPIQGNFPTFGDIYEMVTTDGKFVQMMVTGISEDIITLGELKVNWAELNDDRKWNYVRNITD